ncbi:hypothetical protein PIIN_10385 [Serendipita indica DSM 11827]|uniref:Uncharacterized protein n=1 Tax=Serendipita indica (strain DSM 11827) TaxID=1109443 RepID=G4TYJ9_SERID|nr:hypothetical protein PIIN_10385 [Serendipita indica DSM 11827]
MSRVSHGGASEGTKILPPDNLNILDTTETVLDSQRRTAPPICRLPTEVLIMIFEYSHQFSPFEAPWLLSGICRLFRRILLNTPTVWSSLELSPAAPGPTNPGPDIMKLWLSRCGGVPGKVNISLPPWAPAAAIEAVCANTIPIRFLAFFDHSKFLLNEFPHLEELRLGSAMFCSTERLRGRRTDPWTMMMTNLLPPAETERRCLLDQSRFPKLRRLHLHSPCFSTMGRISQSKGFPPLEQLCIHALGDGWGDIVRPCASSLVKLSVRFEKLDVIPAIESLGMIKLPQLTHLSFICSSVVDWRQCNVPTFVTPRLEYYMQEDFLNSVLIHKDVSNVKTLVIHGFFIGEWDRFPSLETLELHQSKLQTESTCRELVTNPALCPNFEFLKVHRPRSEQNDKNPWPDFFENRTNTSKKRIICNIDVQAHRIDPCYTYNMCDKNMHLNSNHYEEVFYTDNDLDKRRPVRVGRLL